MPKIISPISLGSNSIYAVEDILVKGGYKIVEDITERDSIPEVLLKKGCPVYVKSEETTYRYSNNGNWVKEVSFNGKEIQSKEAPFLISKVDDEGNRRATIVLGEEYTDKKGNKSYQAGIQAEAFDLKAYEINEDGSKTTKAGLRITKEGKVLFRGILCDENGVPLVDLFQNKEIVVVDIFEIMRNQDVANFLELSERALKGEIMIFLQIDTSISVVQSIDKKSDTEANWGAIVPYWGVDGNSTLVVHGIQCDGNSITVSDGYHPLPKAKLPNPSTENNGKVIGITENGYEAVDAPSGGGGESGECAYTEEEQEKLNNAVLKLDNHEKRIQTLEENGGGGGGSGGFIPTVLTFEMLEEHELDFSQTSFAGLQKDFGDGSITTDDTHTFAVGTHTIKVYNATEIAKLSIPFDPYPQYVKLLDIKIGNSVTKIGFHGLAYCNYLTPPLIPDGVTEIGDDAFAYSFNVSSGTWKSLTIPDGVTKIGIRAFMDTGLTSIRLPRGITELPISLCSGCDKLVDIVIPEGVTTIGDYAFTDCEFLKKIELPSTVSAIGARAFLNCKALETVVFNSSEPPTTSTNYSFGSNHKSLKLIVPRTSLEAYKEAWKTDLFKYTRLDSIVYVSTSYKYVHHIHLTKRGDTALYAYINFQIQNDIAEEMTYEDICSYLSENGMNTVKLGGDGAQLSVSGFVISGDSFLPIVGMVSSSDTLYAYSFNKTTGANNETLFKDMTTITDTPVKV